MPLPAIAAALGAALRVAGATAARTAAAGARGGAAAMRGGATAARGAAATTARVEAAEAATAARSAAAAQTETAAARANASSFAKAIDNAKTVDMAKNSLPKQAGADSSAQGRSFGEMLEKARTQSQMLDQKTRQYGDTIDNTKDRVNAWSRRLSESAESLREFSAAANEQAAINERDRRKRQFERGEAVGQSAAFASRQSNRLDQNLSKLVALGELIWNFLEGKTAQFVNYMLEFFRVDTISTWLLDVLKKAMFGGDDKKQPERTPFLGMLGDLARPDAFAPPPIPGARR